MDCKPGKPRLRIPARPSVLGSGLLERARSTTFALLGVTAAVGLAIVALALNQSWPVVPGSPIPGIPRGDEEVGAARVVSRADARGRSGSSAASRDRSGGLRGDRDPGATPAASREVSPSDLAPSGSGESVYASTPVKSTSRGASQKPAQAAPDSQSGPAKPQPQTVTPNPSPQPTPPAAPPASETETPPPPATAASAPPEEESNVPSWSEGRGHAYGRSDRDWGHGGHDDWDRGRSYGHRWDD
ncbi:MAG TPA: hypothetical protein VFT19_13390 [Solirubrobacterales bacterium]|nr:hypothetical protein [Solirubrobacterales bacterium]